MPRGGRPPGAGAPKGNMNGWRTGRHCRRAVEVITEAMRLWNAGERDKVRSIWLAAFAAGGLPRPPAPISSEQAPAAIQLLHLRLFDSETSHAIKRNQSQSVRTPATPIAESEVTPEPAKTPAAAQIAKIQTAIKQDPSVPSVASVDPCVQPVRRQQMASS